MRNAPGILTSDAFQSREFRVSMNTIGSPASVFRFTSSIVIRSGAVNFHSPIFIKIILINFPRPNGRGINLSQTSFALHLSCLDSRCRLGLHFHLHPQSRRSIHLTIPHLFPNMFASRTGIFASSPVTCFVL